MTRSKSPRKTSKKPLSAFGLWSDLAIATGEMMLASGQVIVHRSDRMRAAQLPLSPRDAREFTLMVEEKAAAGQEATAALVAAGTRMALDTPAHMMALVPLAAVVAGSRNLPQLWAAQMRLGQAMVAPMMSNETAKAAHAAVRPFHRRATANAKRLTGK